MTLGVSLKGRLANDSFHKQDIDHWSGSWILEVMPRFFVNEPSELIRRERVRV